MESCRPHRHQPRPCAPRRIPSAPRPRRVAVEVGLGVGGPADKARDLRRMKMLATGLLLGATVVFLLARWGEAVGAPGLGGLRPRHGRGRDGRRAGRLVRRHRALPAADGPADPAHRDHPAQEGPARRQPRRLRRRELPGRGRGARQARARRGRPARGGVDRAGAQRRARHRRARDRRARASSPCCATRTCRRSSTRSWSASCSSGRPARRWAPCWRGSSTTARTTGSSTSCATRPTTG